MAKIYLSPSDQWSNKVADGEHSEAYHCTKIAEAAKKYLLLNGYEVKVGDNDEEGSYKDRVKESNAWGADVHGCIHTNAGGGKGTETLCHPNSKNNKYVKCVYNRIAKLTPTADRGIKTTESLYEINETTAVCVYVEVDFHDNKTIENWIDSHVDEIGKAFAQGICDADGKTFKDEEKAGHLYSVQCGAFTEKDNANALIKKLQSDGFDTYCYTDGGYYKVQCGAYESKSNAEAQAKKLKAKGYSTYITVK